MDANIELVLKKLHKLEEENSKLKSLLIQYGIPFEEEKENNTSSQHKKYSNQLHNLSLQEKVELFRRVFQGREDVFAKRWHSEATRKSGYQPVCEREWNREFCDKRKYKCTECPNRLFSKLSYEYIYHHLAGKDELGRDVVGLYPLLLDNTCYFLCTDFDDKSCEHGFKNDVLAFVSICREWDIPYYIERSRSGNGAHVWIFFDLPIIASKARKLGKTILAEAMNKDSHISFKSYDRFFPNQDCLPEGGFGNLVALPLQGKARKNGNSIFVDDKFQPFTDQWEVLLNIKKISEQVLDQILKAHSNSLGDLTKSSENKPWEVPSTEHVVTTDLHQTSH